MGLFNKLLDGLGVDPKKVEKVMGDIVDGAKNAASEVRGAVNDAAAEGRESTGSFFNGAKSGDSWGEQMPAEPNQYNFNGDYLQYFENIFGTEFARYSIDRMADQGQGSRRWIYNFYNGTVKVLVIELMPESSTAKRTRTAAAREGVPYLRFYYNHRGWWNTRSYVVRRIKTALGIS